MCLKTDSVNKLKIILNARPEVFMATAYPADWTDRACDEVLSERRGPDGTLHPISEERVAEIFEQHRPPKPNPSMSD